MHRRPCHAAVLTALVTPAIIAVEARAQSASRPATDSADVSAVRRAALDYVEGFYEGDSTKLARAVRPEVYKYGFWRQADSARYAGEQMKFPEFFAYAARVRARNRPTPATAPKEIVVYDVQNQTASAKLTASWGTDYLLLGKYDGRWMISSVLWQSPPKR
jgi:hypothetical protein